MGWGGVGCKPSCSCYADDVTLIMGWGGVGWGGMLTFMLNVTLMMLRWSWGGMGWDVNVHVHVRLKLFHGWSSFWEVKNRRARLHAQIHWEVHATPLKTTRRLSAPRCYLNAIALKAWVYEILRNSWGEEFRKDSKGSQKQKQSQPRRTMQSVYSSSSSKVWHPKLCVSVRVAGEEIQNLQTKRLSSHLEPLGPGMSITFKAGASTWAYHGMQDPYPNATVILLKSKQFGIQSEHFGTDKTAACGSTTEGGSSLHVTGNTPKVTRCYTISCWKGKLKVFNALNMLHHLHAIHRPRDKARCIPVHRHVLLTLSPVDSLHLYIFKTCERNRKTMH